jgi:hypothetical protein
MKFALLVGVTLFILTSQAGALTSVERGLTGGFYSATAVGKYEENVCLPVISEQARKYFRVYPERLHREAGMLAIFAIVRSFRCGR